MFWEPVSDSCDVCRCTRLFKNAFKINGTPEASVRTFGSSSSARVRRLIGMASGRMSSPDLGSPCANSQNLECAAIFSPNVQNSTPHKSGGPKSAKPRFPLEEFDPNSQDSGYGGCANYSDEKSGSQCNAFQFAEPLGVAPRRLSLESRSPMKSPLRSSPQRNRSARPALFRSLSSGYESTDDGFNDLIDMESLDNELTRLPNGLSSLISGDIVVGGPEKPTVGMEVAATTPKAPTAANRPNPNLRRSLSLSLSLKSERLQGQEARADGSSGSTPSLSKVRSCLFRSPNASSSAAKLCFDENPRRSHEVFDESLVATGRKFKRPEPPVEHSPTLVKRSRKCASFQDVSLALSPEPALLQRSHSETEAHAHIKSAIHRSTTDSDLTGDFSKPCVLPLADGQHEDLKSISPETLSRLIRGEFDDRISEFKIVDCRYPYEYEAGHIDGALNLFSKEMIEKFLLDPLKHKSVSIEPESQKRSILVFHCEFSWERGPNLSRFLRNIDRQMNKERYPALHYPEIYLLHGGYQKFYKDQRCLCMPQGYRPMRHPDHEADLRQFRSKSKSWQGEKSGRANVVTARANLKRLGF
ncbi:PREDICTED: M-phase inducer phosphatase isoform X2 [Ceratosolen solmsi marchali]|uniref:protein-tyrosine-phosphatase n=1 Tax=Ceratosolen solmsi marchali TaxID=326594 RepID=A0AAJ6VKG2_9HYME|nr:PREDICTED: M-phase inducer phosphatase isoform X2 [Ceratosolen solmsi marchali]